ncbi:sulfatase-like hydrolase/transferase [Hyunsoonleella pacifica]|uniref:Sulfatase n=1 Tax=Hyunsoonleella pacifica TaxID=1080224 RepID=A0A4Q9FNU1_9FLAO|nr:sulfatase-like hydrolase/transferase [Hyunsoonleella pacifica]TBN15433.1 sulfatase [Hyunsoonleella pacifica]GGD24043.1 N-acetylgalactosamine-6-sulfatase [Hyunsoonleella pacifica]
MKLPTLTFVLLIALLSCGSSDDIDTPKDDTNIATNTPNILLIIADDMGVDASPGYAIGDIKPNMPNLESMISSGIVFNNIWSYAVCTPTRASILTGKYGFRTGVTGVGDVLSTSETSIQRHLDTNNSGYAHAVIGKWHLSSDTTHPNNMGVGTYAGFLSGGVRDYWEWSLVENGQTIDSDVYTTTKFTDLAIDWVNAQTQPWFLWLAYNAPHTPFHLPDTNLHSQGNLPSDQASVDNNPLPYYMAMLEAMDTEIGRLLDSMTQEERDNTIIVFIGDNGTPNRVVQEYPGRRAKNSVYEGGIRVPMIISGAGVTRKGVTEDAILNSTDLFATIASIADAEVGAMSDSKDFKPMLSTSGVKVRDYSYAEVNSGGVGFDYAIRNDTYKYIRFVDDTEAFYNLSSDPLETTNLLNSNGGLTNEEASNKTNLETQLNNIKI